jgi:hypothetical protein
MLESLKILILCVGSAVLYGILHDQVTARVCVEYFTVGHPPIFNTESPTLLALGWGVIATWWVGVMLAIPGILVSRVGRWPKVTAAELVRPIAVLLVTMAVASTLAGFAGYYLAITARVWLVDRLAEQMHHSKHAYFLADGFAHGAAYAVGFLGGIVLCGWILFHRRNRALALITPAS